MRSILDYIKVFKNIETYKGREPRNMFADGQLVQNTVDGSRPGYSGKKGMKQPNKIMRREYSSEQFDKFSDDEM